MRVIGTDKLYKFIRKHADSKGWLETWLSEARSGEWQSPNDIKVRYNSASILDNNKVRYNSASILDNNKVIFNIKGNKYRMEVQVSYNTKVIAIKRLGTHAEYNRWDIQGGRYGSENY